MKNEMSGSRSAAASKKVRLLFELIASLESSPPVLVLVLLMFLKGKGRRDIENMPYGFPGWEYGCLVVFEYCEELEKCRKSDNV